MKNKNEILDFFKDVTFNEELHQYFVNGILLRDSVTQLLKDFKDHPDFYNISKFVAIKEHKTQEEILKEWNDKKVKSQIIGNNLHSFCENYINDKNTEPKTLLDKYAIMMFNEIPSYIIPLVTELKMYHKEYMFPGTLDLLLYNKNTSKYIILDFKTNEDIHKNFKGKTLLKPFDNLLDCPLNEYKIQTSLYQILLEQIPGIKIEKRVIFWIPQRKIIFTEDYSDILKDYLKTKYKK